MSHGGLLTYSGTCDVSLSSYFFLFLFISLNKYFMNMYKVSCTILSGKIDLQDCFFNIKLHPEDCKRFAFSVPSPNFKRPYQRFQWKVLPQGMKNSPTLCQKFVDKAILTVRDKYQDSYIVHYMDDILLAHPSRSILTPFLPTVHNLLPRTGTPPSASQRWEG